MNQHCQNDPLTCRCWYHQGHPEEKIVSVRGDIEDRMDEQKADEHDATQQARINQMLIAGEKLPDSAMDFLNRKARGRLSIGFGAGVIHPHWRHKRTGGVYVIDPQAPIVFRTRDALTMVVYGPVRSTAGDYRWARSLDEFLERFEPVRKAEGWEVV